MLNDNQPSQNPYVGPRTFTYEDREHFFGRESEAAALLARVISQRLLLFYAQSGAGKSSLINTRLVPNLREAFSGQLAAAGLPFHSLNMWFVPLVELVVGIVLIVGFFARLASLVAIVMMLVATYVHLAVDNPDLFPLQPEAPFIPLIAIALCLYVLRAGSGSWSWDLRQQRSVSR